MTPEEFLDKIVCPKCQTRIDQDSKISFTWKECRCGESKSVIYGATPSIQSINVSLCVDEYYLVHVNIWENRKNPVFFYISTIDRPFYPLFHQSEIPDYIFFSREELIKKIEILTTFS